MKNIGFYPIKHLFSLLLVLLTAGQMQRAVVIQAQGNAAVTQQKIIFVIEGEDEENSALYIEAGRKIEEADLLAGISATDEEGHSVTVSVQGTSGLSMDNPQPGGTVDYPTPYEVIYEAIHPVTGEAFYKTRNLFVTQGFSPLAALSWTGTAAPTVADGDEVTLGGEPSGTLAVPANATVTIVGAVSDTTQHITLDIGSGATVVWAALYTSSPSGGAVITTVGDGMLKLAANTWIQRTNGGTVIDVQGAEIWLSESAVVESTTGTIVEGSGVDTVVRVTDQASIMSDASSNFQPLINMSNPANTGDNVIISGGAIYALNSTGEYGYGVQTYGNVVMSGGEIITEAIHGRGINLVGLNSKATVSAGVISAEGSGGVAISTATTGTPATAVANASVEISGTATVTSAGNYVIRMLGNNAQVSVKGGVVSNTGSGTGIFSGSIAPQGESVHVTGGVVMATTGYAVEGSHAVEGGLLFVYGSVDADIVRSINRPSSVEETTAVLVAWDTAAGRTTYMEGQATDLHKWTGTEEATAVWHKDPVLGGGILYKAVNGAQEQFLLLPVTVEGDFGLIFNTNDGKLYYDVDSNQAVSASDVLFTLGKGTTWDVAGTDRLILTGFSWSTSKPFALCIVGDPGAAATIEIHGSSSFSAIIPNANRREDITGTGIYAENLDLIIEGDGALLGLCESKAGEEASSVQQAFCAVSAENLTLNGGTLTARTWNNSGADCASTGISVGGAVVINGGKLQVEASEAFENGGIGVHGSVVIQQGYFQTSGKAAAMDTSPEITPAGYAYWTEDDFAVPLDGDGMFYAPGSDADAYIYTSEQRHIRIVTGGATVNNGTILGTKGSTLATQTAVLTLYGDTVAVDRMEDARSWFSALPQGVHVSAALSGGSNEITLTFSGIPENVVAAYIFDITIPADVVASNTAIEVHKNSRALISVGGNPEESVPATPSVPYTGDDSYPALWATIVLISCLAVAMLLLWRNACKENGIW